jgi:hypothetical protein
MGNETITSASDFLGIQAQLRVIAEKHFAKGSYEREFLLDVAKSYGQLWLLHHNLKCIQERVDRLNAIDAPKNIDIIHVALNLEQIAKGLTDPELAMFARRAHTMLDVWSEVNLNLRALMDISKDFRFLGNRPEGSA